MLRLPVILVALLLAAVACGGDSPPPKSPDLTEVLPNLPLPPNPTFVSRGGGADAVQITLKSSVEVGDVAAYYRGLFKKAPWRLVNETPDQHGGVAFLAEHTGQPIWVRLQKDQAGGTLVDIAGARLAKGPDSSKAQGAAPPAGAKPAS